MKIPDRIPLDAVVTVLSRPSALKFAHPILQHLSTSANSLKTPFRQQQLSIVAVISVAIPKKPDEERQRRIRHEEHKCAIHRHPSEAQTQERILQSHKQAHDQSMPDAGGDPRTCIILSPLLRDPQPNVKRQHMISAVYLSEGRAEA